ncbi:MAG: hypothetical protein SCM11_09940 [Bacillota bacterium]|nr:hypothetical protein [Bacillota bacterium]
MSSWGYKEYVPASVKKARAARSIEKLRKKNPDLAPIQITGRKLAKTWWGIAWNENLERYADYANRIERGRSYVRQGSVLDLQIEPGRVTAQVQGTRLTPYKVELSIMPLKPATWQKVVDACTGSINSLQDLISGKFPKNLAELFTAKGDGLFPTPKEIRLSCSCPDWATMCKHVAAALYGVGARLDEDPTLFFRLRLVNMDDLITNALGQTTDALLQRSQKKSRRAIDHADLAGLFGIDMTDQVAPVLKDEEPAPPDGNAKKPAKKPFEKPAAKKPTVRKTAVAEKTSGAGKKRGRPRKIAVEPAVEHEPVTVEKPVTVKKRGRPRKTTPTEG